MNLDPQVIARVQTFVGVSADREFGPVTLAAVEKTLREAAPLMGRTYPVSVAPLATITGEPSALGRKLVALAQREVGVHEVGGENCGPRIREYQAATDLPPGPWPWCAAFLCWVIREAILKGG